MDELIGKITNFGYEIFGVILPGCAGLLFFLFYWWALGEVPAALSSNNIPNFEYFLFSSRQLTAVDTVALVALIYFVGHLLNWLSRKPKKDVEGIFLRLGCCLIFRIPRSSRSFSEHLTEQFLLASKSFGIQTENVEEAWEKFFPVAKVVLAERLTRSLVSTYQNKYTLYRSVAGAAVLLWWTTLASIVFLMFAGEVNPRWLALSFCWVGSSILIWGFSSSFDYHWSNFGNAIVTESFALLTGFTKR